MKSKYKLSGLGIIIIIIMLIFLNPCIYRAKAADTVRLKNGAMEISSKRLSAQISFGYKGNTKYGKRMKVCAVINNKRIFFVPDNNLGRYVAKQLPEKEFIFNDGFCHVHKSIDPELVKEAKEHHPDALVLAHPECTEDVLELADYIGSTAGILDYATESDCKKFIICTEMGIFFKLSKQNPDKKFYSVGHRQFCPNMKKVSLEKVADVMENPMEEVILPDNIMDEACKPLQKMLELAK